jgi:serine/threonine protein phosphatase PrpC
MPWRKNKDKGKAAGPADGPDTDAAQPLSQRPEPGDPDPGSQQRGRHEGFLQEDHEPSPPEGTLQLPGAQQAEPDQGPGRHAQRSLAQGAQQQVTDDPGSPDRASSQSALMPGPSSGSEDMHSEIAAGQAVMSAETDTEAPAPAPAAAPAPAGGAPASTQPDSAPEPGRDAPAQQDPAPHGQADAAVPAAPARPQIPLTTQAPSADSGDTGSLAFPEPLVLGAMPTLRPDPRGLPVPDQVPGPVVPDSVLDGADFEGLLIRGASLRGDRHRHEATVRQDSMGMWRIGTPETPAVLVCVTDGVSSEPLSHRGAAEACRLLREAVALDVPDLFKAPAKHRLRPVWENIAQDICDRLIAVAGYLAVAPRALSTTLAAALVELNPEDPAQRRCVILSVGDATAFLLGDGEFHPLLADPHDAAITSTATYALPTSRGEVGVAAGVMGPGDVLMVCTDGMSNPMRNEDVRAQLAEWWGTGRVPSMAEFGWQLSYRVKSYDDDRTAVCVWGR